MLIMQLYALISLFLTLLTYALILSCLMSMLLAFGIFNPHNRAVYMVATGLHRVTEPVLAPIRSLLPQFGAVDFSPLILLLLIQYIIRPGLFHLFLSAANAAM